MRKSSVLLSGGLDSTVNFCKALRSTEVVVALTFDYGQRAAPQEIQAAKQIAENHHVRHEVIVLDWLKKITRTALVNRKEILPTLSQETLDDLKYTTRSAQVVWVPNRNGVFINIAAAYGEAFELDDIVVGFNAEEAVTFPDNSVEFIHSMNQTLAYSTQRTQKVVCYTDHMTKKEIVRFGQELRAPFHLMWSCYEGGEAPCQKCESCLRFQRAVL